MNHRQGFSESRRQNRPLDDTLGKKMKLQVRAQTGRKSIEPLGGKNRGGLWALKTPPRVPKEIHNCERNDDSQKENRDGKEKNGKKYSAPNILEHGRTP